MHHRRHLRWLVAAALALPLILQLAFSDPAANGLQSLPGIGAAIGMLAGLAILLAARLLAALLGRDQQPDEDREGPGDD